MLFSRVSKTLAGAPDPCALALISAFTLAQILAGWALGEVAAAAAERWLPGPSDQAAAAASAAAAQRRGGAAAKQAAAAAAEQAAALRRLVSLACAFGSSFTLPVVFFRQGRGRRPLWRSWAR